MVYHRCSSNEQRMSFLIYLSSHILISISLGNFKYFLFSPPHTHTHALALLTTNVNTTRNTTLLVSSSACRSSYHHFSKIILSFWRPRSKRDFEIASIMGGGPHK